MGVCTNCSNSLCSSIVRTCPSVIHGLSLELRTVTTIVQAFLVLILVAEFVFKARVAVTVKVLFLCPLASLSKATALPFLNLITPSATLSFNPTP